MKYFHHEGCRSGQCIWQQLGMAMLTTAEITDVKNHIKEKQREWELRNEARRLLNEQEQHSALGSVEELRDAMNFSSGPSGGA